MQVQKALYKASQLYEMRLYATSVVL